jgi:hypothetical protein
MVVSAGVRNRCAWITTTLATFDPDMCQSECEPAGFACVQNLPIRGNMS